MVNSLSVESGGSANEAMNLIAFRQEEFSQI